MAGADAMSQFQAFRRQATQQQFAQNLRTETLPAPTRGIIQHENEAYMQPGGAIVADNWLPTMKGIKLRGGCIRFCDLHALDVPVPPVPDPSRKPVVSAFTYITATQQRMFAAQQTKLFECTTSTPVLVASGRTSGNYGTAQITNAAGVNFLIAVNDAGDLPLRFNGTSWATLANSSGTASDGVTNIYGATVSYVCKYRNRLYFVGSKSMSMWFLPVGAVGGALTEIPMSASTTKGGYILFAASWSIDAGDGIDDKLAIVTSEGEILIFSGGDPATDFTQEGRYAISPPLGINAWSNVGGDLLILTVDGIVPISQAITKSAGQLELALVTRAIKPMWRSEVALKRAYPWTMAKWDDYGANFVTFPGGPAGNRYCLAMNNTTGAFARCVGWDAMCFIRKGADMFFGTQDGIVMQADRTGKDDGLPYVATLVFGWDTFGQPSNEFIWHQARAVFSSGNAEPFQPMLSACTDYVITIPPPPPAGPDPGGGGGWDAGLWDTTPPSVSGAAVWDASIPVLQPVRNTLWQSIGVFGFAHAAIVQVTVAQTVKPDVELIAITATYEPAGVNV